MLVSADRVTSLAKSVVRNRRGTDDRLCCTILHHLSQRRKPRTCTSTIVITINHHQSSSPSSIIIINRQLTIIIILIITTTSPPPLSPPSSHFTIFRHLRVTSIHWSQKHDSSAVDRQTIQQRSTVTSQYNTSATPHRYNVTHVCVCVQ